MWSLKQEAQEFKSSLAIQQIQNQTGYSVSKIKIVHKVQPPVWKTIASRPPFLLRGLWAKHSLCSPCPQRPILNSENSNGFCSLCVLLDLNIKIRIRSLGGLYSHLTFHVQPLECLLSKATSVGRDVIGEPLGLSGILRALLKERSPWSQRWQVYI